MESSEFYSELKANGLQLANHDGKLRVGPKEKLTKEDRELLKAFKEELLVLPAIKKVHSVSEHSERCEPKSRVFSREKVHTDADNKIFSNILNSNNVHNVHQVHPGQRTLNSVSLDHGFFQTIKPVSKKAETIRNMMLGQINQLCACKTWFVI